MIGPLAFNDVEAMPSPGQGLRMSEKRISPHRAQKPGTVASNLERDRRFSEPLAEAGWRSRSSRYTFHITAAWRIIHTGASPPCSPLGARSNRKGSAMAGISEAGSEAKPGANRTRPEDAFSGFVNSGPRCVPHPCGNTSTLSGGQNRDRANGCTPCIGGGVAELATADCRGCAARYRLPSVLNKLRHEASLQREHPMPVMVVRLRQKWPTTPTSCPSPLTRRME